jgi:pimeloyl-ACP methyl ester carboxylesterase
MAISRREVRVDGVRSPVYEAGETSSAEAAVFVHGNPGSGRDWTDLMERLAPHVRVVAPDMPGYADADKPRGFDHSAAGYARHLDGVLAQLGVERAHLVLHDFGGLWGLEWVLQNPEAAASVTLLGIGVFDKYRWHPWARVWRTPGVGEAVNYTTPRAVARAILARENPRLSAEHADRLSRQMTPYGTRRAILACYRATPPAMYESRPTADGPVSRATLLRPLDLPALVLWPTEDDYVPFAPEYQRHAFPSARIEVVEGHGHWLHWEAPERVAESVVPFVVDATTTGRPEAARMGRSDPVG